MSLFSKRVYFDSASFLPVLPAVFRIFKKVSRKQKGNPSSIHKEGLWAGNLLADSRLQIAKIINAHSDEIVFTGSGTESISLAIMGAVFSAPQNSHPHIITTSIEHSAVIETCKLLEERGSASVSYIEPDEYGNINPNDIKSAIKSETILISVHLVNGELGVVQDIKDIFKIVKRENENRLTNKIIIHTDACQAVPHIDIANFVRQGVDMISWNSSKLGGPLGIGALYKKRSVKLEPIYAGGAQEFGLRSGTVALPLVAGFAKAMELSKQDQSKNENKFLELRKYFLYKMENWNAENNFKLICNSCPQVGLVESTSPTCGQMLVPSIISCSFPYFSGEQMAIELDARGIAVASKSACQNDSGGESHVITAIRKSTDSYYKNWGTIRISFAPNNTTRDIDKFFNALNDIFRVYKNML